MGLQAPAGAVAGYGDVPAGTWYTDAVQWSANNFATGVTSACFRPDTPVSRGEAAVWIYNMEDRPDAGERHPFTDVTNDGQHDAISWMANNGITTGASPTTFAPDETLKRAQAAAFLHRLAGEPSAPPHSFTDVVAGWQQDPVAWMAHTGITTGTSATTFAPDSTLTRAHLVTFLYRYQDERVVAVNPSTPGCDPATDVAEDGFKAVSAGSDDSCAIRSDDSVVCWDTRGWGQPDAPTGSFKAVSTGSDRSCGIRIDDSVVCWGNTRFGHTDPPTGSFKAVSVNGGQSCGIRTDNTNICWGFGDSLGSPYEAVSVGPDYVCGIGNRSDDSIVCVGNAPASDPTGSFKAVSAGGHHVSVVRRESHFCGIRSDDTIACWGNNTYTQRDAPEGTFVAVSAGGAHSCGLRTDDTIACWGSNGNGQTDAPTGRFKAVSAGHDHTCGIRADGSIVCWGLIKLGQADDRMDDESDMDEPETSDVVAAFDSNGDGTVTIGVAAMGPRDDNGYYQSLVDFVEQFSADNGFAPPIVSDNIGRAEATAALSDLAQQGVDILMVGASEIAGPLPDLTEQYPDIFWYCNCGVGFQELPGLAQATDWGAPIHYTAGVAMAGILADHGGDNAVFLGCCDINFEREAYNATVFGLQSVDPNLTMDYVSTGDYEFDFDNSANATAALTNAIADGVTLAYAYLGGALEAVGRLATDEGVAVFAAGPADVCERDDGINWTGSIVYDRGVYAREALRLIIAGDLVEGVTYQFPTEPGLNGALLCEGPAGVQALLDGAFAQIAASDGELLGALAGVSDEAYSGG